jgi:hypothetical protein
MEYVGITNIENYTPKELFTLLVKGVNIITPEIERYEKIKVNDNLIRVVEVSYGEGIDRKGIYGLTVVEYRKKGNVWEGRHDFDLSTACHSLDEVNRHLEFLHQP